LAAGAKVPGAKISSMELSFLGAKVRGNKSSIISHDKYLQHLSMSIDSHAYRLKLLILYFIIVFNFYQSSQELVSIVLTYVVYMDIVKYD